MWSPNAHFSTFTNFSGLLHICWRFPRTYCASTSIERRLIDCQTMSDQTHTFKKGSRTSFPGVWQRPRNHSFMKGEWGKIQQEKTLRPSDLCATHLRFSSIPLTPVSCLGIRSKVLFDGREPTRSLASRPVPAAATTPRAGFFVPRYQWLLFYKRSSFN